MEAKQFSLACLGLVSLLFLCLQGDLVQDKCIGMAEKEIPSKETDGKFGKCKFYRRKKTCCSLKFAQSVINATSKLYDKVWNYCANWTGDVSVMSKYFYFSL